MSSRTPATKLIVVIAILAVSDVGYAGTPANLREVFERASEIVLFQTPVSESAQSVFSKETVREHAAFISVTLCRQCEIAGGGLLEELLAARQIRGDCPRPTSVIDLRSSDHVTISAIYFGRAGRCFEFDGHSYALESRSLAKKFTALSRELR
jgi:hypothetical protein